MIDRLLVSFLTASLIVLTTAAAAASQPRSGLKARCASYVGNVISYVPHASGSCSSQTYDGEKLYAGEAVTSRGPGKFAFMTHHLHECIQFASPRGTGDILRPRRGVLLRHLRGTTYCLHAGADQGPRTLRTPGAVVHLHGTMFALESDGRNSTVKVKHGRIRAVSTFDGRAVTIKAGYRDYFPANRPPGRPRPFTGSSTDVEAFALLFVDGAPTGVAEVAQGLKKAGVHSAILVALDSATVSSERSALGKNGIKVHALLASQLQKDPSLLTNTATQFNLQNVIVAASVDQAPPLLDTVHQDDTNGDLTIYFVDTTP